MQIKASQEIKSSKTHDHLPCLRYRQGNNMRETVKEKKEKAERNSTFPTLTLLRSKPQRATVKKSMNQ
jgi:hypothetical protein